MRKSKKPKPLRGSFATIVEPSGRRVTDLRKLSKVLMNWGETPNRLTDIRAYELALLAASWAGYHKSIKNLGGK